MRAGSETGRLTAVGRRIVYARDLPAAIGGLLGLVAAIEVTAGTGDSPLGEWVALILGLAATVPLIFVRTHAVAVTAAITVATTLAVVTTGHRPTTAALVAQAIVAGLLVIRLAERIRAIGRRRAAARLVAADTLAEFAARGERARIARELHDVVAHHLSMISLQVEAARLSTPDLHPDGARRLADVGDTARSALTEMRRLLGLLREDAGTGATPVRTPQPGLEQLHDLIGEARRSSPASTRLIVRGRVAPLDPGIELTAYRIVQEALTNARRHAAGAAVDVELIYSTEALRLRVRDNGPGPATPGPAAGHGLLGMRERAAMVGGRLTAGPAPGCGFLVEARLPTAEVPA